jgi:mannitol-1-/sugar-/sorbitol-6-phosphatase
MDNSIRMTCQAVLFDLDGTLVDSTARINRVWQSWAERNGIPYETLVPIMHGRPAIETVRMVAPHLQPEAELRALELDEISDMQGVYLLPGARALLGRLDRDRWAVVTSGTDRVAQARLHYVNLPMPPVLITIDQIARGKPAPDGYLLAAQRLGMAPDQCIVVEDAPVGVQAGKAAGMRVIAIASSQTPESLQAADVVVSRLTDLDLRCESGIITIRAAV